VFGIGMQEIVLILVIALIVIGPKKLPEVATALGRAYAEFRRAFDDMKRSVETEIHSEELRRSLMDVPPPPAPPAPAPPPESLVAASAPAPNPYPAVHDAAPPPPEQPEPAARPGAGTEDAGGRS
jgi:Tat protein translocase TatB subunit